MNQDKRLNRYEKWQALIEAQQKSGLSQKKFCEQNQLVLSQFVYFNNKMKIKKNKTESETNLFVPVKINKAEVHKFEIHLVLPNGFQCYFPSHVDALQIKRVVEILLSC